MADEQPPKPEPTPLPSGGLAQRLIKAWRLRPLKLAYPHDHAECGLYVCPKSGVFYARVPEDDEGTLYTATTLRDLCSEVADALRAWLDQEAEAAMVGRVWERCIRVRYKSRSDQVGSIVKAETEGHREVGSRWAIRQAVDVVPCVDLGVLTYSRFERSLQPEGDRYDEREWAEDFERRLAQWRGMEPGRRGLTQEDHRRMKPERGRAVSWATTKKTFWGRDRPEVRVLPWNQDTWDRLGVLAARFGQLDAALHKLLIEADQEVFLKSLGCIELPPLLPGPTTEEGR